MQNKLSVIIPAFNEQENIPKTAEVIGKILDEAEIPAEIIFVDDGSRDGSWEIINELSARALFGGIHIRGLKFSRNFGKEGAIFAGLRHCTGDCAVVIDCDLQHPPELIPKMYALWQQGVEVIEAKKSSRGKESLLYKIFAKSFYKMMKSSSDINLDRASDFKLLDRKAIDALNELPERITFFRALSSWVGFKTAEIEFEVQPRNAGKTKWSFKKLFKFALSNLTGFTTLPMQITTFMGVLFGVFAVILGVQTLINFFSGKALGGFSTVILLLLIIGCFLMLGLGIIGYYISKIYDEIKFRPRYIVSIDTDGDKKIDTERVIREDNND